MTPQAFYLAKLRWLSERGGTHEQVSGLFSVTALAAAAVMIWANLPVFTKHAVAIAAPTTGLSPDELQRHIDKNTLPAQAAADPIER